MFDFLLIYPLAFLIGFWASVIPRGPVLKRLMLSAFTGSVPGAVATLISFPDAAEVPREFGEVLVTTVLWTSIFSLTGGAIALVLWGLLRRMQRRAQG